MDSFSKSLLSAVNPFAGGGQQRQRSTETSTKRINSMNLHNRFSALSEDEDDGIKLEAFAGQDGEF